MTVGARRFAAAAVGLVLSGWAGGAPTTPAAPAHSVAEPSLTAEGPAVNWDTPFPGGIDVTPAEAQAVGGLAFTPVTPDFAGRVRFIRDGVYYDLKGPNLLPDTAITLAQELAATVAA